MPKKHTTDALQILDRMFGNDPKSQRAVEEEMAKRVESLVLARLSPKRPRKAR